MEISIDLETFGVNTQAPIVQLGAVAFDLNTGDIASQFEVTINLQSALLTGGRLDVSTSDWWKTQSKEARDSITEGRQAHIFEVLNEFCEWAENLEDKHGPMNFWAKGPGDDLAWLRGAYERCGIPEPWKFNQARDLRTLIQVAEAKGWQRSRAPVAHTALLDAAAQAKEIVSAWKWIINDEDRVRQEIVQEMEKDIGPQPWGTVLPAGSPKPV